MKKVTYKLWIVVLLIIVILGIASLKYTIPVTLETTDGVTVSAEYDAEYDGEGGGGPFAVVAKDFKNFLAIIGDLFKTVFQGEESQFESGLDAIRGKEEVDTSEVSEILSENGKILNEKKETIAEVFEKESGTIGVSDAILTKCQVLHVVDGDTLMVDLEGTELKVRLIGLDTPESVHEDEEKNTVWGALASENTKNIVSEGATVYLEYDIDATDKYGRTLAYVWLSDDTSDIMNMLNARIIADGYAIDKVYEPNSKYADVFDNISKEAAENNNGLWKEEEVRTLWQ